MNGWMGRLDIVETHVVVFIVSMAALTLGAAIVVFFPVLRRSRPEGEQTEKSDPPHFALTKSKLPGERSCCSARADPSLQPGNASDNPSPARSTIAPSGSDYRQLVEHIEQIVFRLDSSGNLVFLSPSWEQLLDYSVKDSLQQPLTAFIHPEDRQPVEAQLSGVLRGRRDRCQMETRIIARNDTSYWSELRAIAVRAESGGVIGTLTDISERKQVESGLKAMGRSLSTLLNTVPGMVYRCKANRNWSFEFASDGCLEITGYEPFQLVNDPDFYFRQIMFPDDREHAWNHVHHQVMLHRDFQLMYRIVNRTGHVKWVWEQGRGVYSNGGELLALEGFIALVAKDAPHAKSVLRDFQELIYEEQAIP